MKQLIVIILMLAGNNLLFSQVSDTMLSGKKGPTTNLTDSSAKGKNPTAKNNVIKMNLSALPFNNFSVQYERKTGSRSSFAVTVNYRPKGDIPFENAVADAVDDASIRVDLMQISDFGITPEYRFYLEKKGAFEGFYIGPLVSYHHYSGDIPMNYSDYVNNMSIEKTAIYTGSTNAFTFGFQLGAQWKLGKKIYLDWWILGPSYGFSNGDFIFNGALNDIEQISMQYELEKLKQTMFLVNIEIPEKPNDNGAIFRITGPWVGIRAFGLNLGYRF